MPTDPSDLATPLGFVLDGSNLWRMARGAPLRVLDGFVGALHRQYPGHRCVIFADATLRHQLPPSEHADFRGRLAEGRLIQTPAGENGDPHLLAFARAHRAVVVSRDRFRDHPELRWDIPVLTPRVDATGSLRLDHALIHTSDRRLLRVEVAAWLAART